ncbi:MAG: hypothetical protein WA715_11205 [Candidatus Acidiferrum sp.]|jgi:hypothetical protein
MKKIHLLVAVAVGLTAVGGMAFRATGQEGTGSTQEEKATVIGFVRTINTAEVVYKMSAGDRRGGGPRGRYGTWADLHSSGETEKYLQECPMAREDWSRQGIDQRGIPGYRVDLIVSPDGQSYSLAVHDQQEGHGLFSVFSDQVGIIYLAEPLQ